MKLTLQILSGLMVLGLLATISCGEVRYKGYDEISLSEKFSAPVKEGVFVATTYKYQLEKGNSKDFAEVILNGFTYSDRYAVAGDNVCVIIVYTDGSTAVYYVTKADFAAYQRKEIGSEEFLNRIRVRS